MFIPLASFQQTRNQSPNPEKQKAARPVKADG
jgi:hypothetical protein